jgi:Condensation domain
MSSERRALLLAELRERRRAAAGATAISRRAETGPAPLSFSQQRMWFLDQWEPGAPTQNGARAIRIRGELDVEALAQAFRTVVERHTSLRTVFVLHGREPRQVVLHDWSLELHVVDLTSSPGELAGRLRELAREPFDLSRDLMIRTTLFRLGPEETVLLVRLHHIAADAFSDAVLMGEVSEIYRSLREGVVPDLPELPVQYADFACWQLDRVQGKLLDDLVGYWTNELRGVPELLPLPTDRPRRRIQRHEGGRHEVQLSAGVAAGVRRLAREESCTVYMVMLGVFSTLLYRLAGVDDIVVGSPIANRTTIELTPMIGFFCNTVALRTRLGGNPSFRQVCSRVRTTALGAYEHQELPFERIVELLNIPRDPAYNPIFQVNFRAIDGARLPLQLAGAETTPVPVDIGFSRFDLALEVNVEADGVSGYFEFDRDLFDAATVAAVAADFEALVEQVLADPDLPILAVQLPHGPRPAAKAQPAIPRRRNESHAREKGT